MSVVYNGRTIASNPKFHPDLFDWKWSDHILNNPSWVRADPFSEQDKEVYGPAYNHLAADITGKSLQSETVAGTTVQFYLADDGHKVCPVSESNNVTAIYNATGVAWYYIIDTTNQWFKLPRAKHNKYAATLGVVGNGIALGLTDGTQSFAVTLGLPAANTVLTSTGTSDFGAAVGASVTQANLGTNKGVGVTADPDKSGIIAQQEQDTDQYKYLYFYVGNFTQTALENTAGINTELFNDKANVDLDNVSATGKATSVGWGIPDYSAGVSESTSGFTASKAGLVVVRWGNSSDDCDIFVNGYSLGIEWYNIGSTRYVGTAIPVDKGDVVTFTRTVIGVKFFPFKGAQ